MNTDNHLVHVAVGIIENSNQEILIAKRQKHQDQGGLWEFPGGKLYKGESVIEGLRREIKEELDINVHDQRPLIQIKHSYKDYSVLLDVWKVIDWSGVAKGMEGQEIVWQKNTNLQSRLFPQANKTIISTIELPDQYFITPEPSLYEEAIFLNKIEAVLCKGIKLVQFRSKLKSPDHYEKLTTEVMSLCKKYDSRLLINTEVNGFNENIFDGLHINSKLLNTLKQRPIIKNKILSVSCHNKNELIKATEIDADLILLGSVKQTKSHSNLSGMGWSKFKSLTEQTNLPVYALGGLNSSDLETSWYHGAQGIAMISGLWEEC